MPSALPPKPPINIDDEIIQLLIKSHSVLAILDDKSTSIPNIELFISMYVQKEALYHRKLKVLKQL